MKNILIFIAIVFSAHLNIHAQGFLIAINDSLFVNSQLYQLKRDIPVYQNRPQGIMADGKRLYTEHTILRITDLVPVSEIYESEQLFRPGLASVDTYVEVETLTTEVKIINEIPVFHEPGRQHILCTNFIFQPESDLSPHYSRLTATYLRNGQDIVDFEHMNVVLNGVPMIIVICGEISGKEDQPANKNIYTLRCRETYTMREHHFYLTGIDEKLLDIYEYAGSTAR